MDFECKEEAVKNLLADAEMIMEELFQSGFNTVHDSTIDALKEITKRTEQFGMAYLSHLLGTIEEGITMRRHKMTKEADRLVETFTKLSEYLYLCRQQIAYNSGQTYYTKEL